MQSCRRCAARSSSRTRATAFARCSSRCWKTCWWAASARRKCAPPATWAGRLSCMRSTAPTCRWMPDWTGDPDEPRYGFATGRTGVDAVTPLRDNELMYVRLNPRTHTAFGLGRLEVAFETIGQFLSANRYAGRLASNSVVQYALWLDEATPEQHDRLIRWWQDEIEGTGPGARAELGKETGSVTFCGRHGCRPPVAVAGVPGAHDRQRVRPAAHAAGRDGRRQPVDRRRACG